MEDFIATHFTSIITTIIGGFIGGITGGITLHLCIKKNSDNTATNQKNITAGRDVAGRDIKN